MMRISFDLDETIISRNIDWEVEPDLIGFRGNEERLRKGTVELFKWIREQNHEIWIYTNSYRGWKALESWFRDCGIPVDGVINQVIHDEKRYKQEQTFKLEKNPKWFGIDLHFDDLDELAGRYARSISTDKRGMSRIKRLIAVPPFKAKQVCFATWGSRATINLACSLNGLFASN